VTEYLDTAGVARLLGVRPQTVSRYRMEDRHPPFPEPDITISGRPGWRPETIQAWQAERPGRGHRVG